MRKTGLVFLLFLIFEIAAAQTEKQIPKIDVVKTGSYFFKNDGTKIEGSGIQLTNAHLGYFDMKGEHFNIPQSDIKELILGSQLYTSLLINRNMHRLLRVIAINDKYILSIYTFTGESSGSTSYLYVHDKITKEIVVNKVSYHDWSTDYEDIQKPIKKYFSECSSLIEKMNLNSVKQREEKKVSRKGPFFGVNNISCSK